MPRAGFFIDGFNLYHAIDDLNQPHLKWSNYWRMAELVMAKDEELAMVVAATAYYPDFSKRVRHERHVAALESVGVKVLLGHYVHEDMDCFGCPRKWKKPTEKEGDINIALALLDAANRDLFDTAYLVTADSDHAATARIFAKRFPKKRIISVSPPGRSHSKHILAHAKPAALTEDHMDLSVFPAIVPSKAGGKAMARPKEYDPPVGWMHPDDRPQPKPKAGSAPRVPAPPSGTAK